MSTATGVACECTKCSTPQWYDNGVCQGCRSGSDIQFTWIANPKEGGRPPGAPGHTLQLEPGARTQLIEIWDNLVLLRGLTPHLKPGGSGVVEYSTPPWYVKRGVRCTVRFAKPWREPEKLNRASGWTNQSFIVRAVATFEAFASPGKPNQSRLPNARGMREFHHARRLRNAIAHGDSLNDARLVNEARHLFTKAAVDDNACKLDIDKVLEPLWARLLVYAWSLEDAAAVPSNPAVVVVADENGSTVQTFDGVREVAGSGSSWSVGHIISLTDSA